MKFYLSAALIIIALSGCRSFDLTMNSSEQFASLYDSPITVNTSDSIIVIRNTGGVGKRSNVLVPVVFTTEYKIDNDSIIFSGQNFTGIIPFGIIKSVGCRGVWDKKAGFISEKEILANYEGSISIITPVLMGIGGIPIGGIIGYALPRNRSGWFDGMAETIAGSLVGLAVGIIAGILLEKDWEYDNAIERIKEKRLNKPPNQNLVK